jgi:DNA-binding NarL/FixJ family response regulator
MAAEAAVRDEAIERGRLALTEGRWGDAREAFETSLARRESPEALEGLGTALANVDDPALFAADERAYRLYRERDDPRGAARVATHLAWLCATYRGEPAVANGWLQRAKRLLEPLEPCVEQGWLALREGSSALNAHGDTATALARAEDARALGVALGAADLEAVATGLGGLALVCEGLLEDGMRRLDEAAASAAAGETGDPNTSALAVCWLMFGCSRVKDLDRATEWSRFLRDFAERFDIRPLVAVCRAQYAQVAMWRGEWDEAERELRVAVDDLAETRPAQVGEALVVLGELERRRGDAAEARALFERSGEQVAALVGLARLALDRGDAEEAQRLGDRALRRLSERDRVDRVPALEVLAEAAGALGLERECTAAADELVAIAGAVPTPAFRASADLARGIALATSGDREGARRALEDAIDGSGNTPFEAARARVALARVLAALGRDDAAATEIRSALAAFDSLGAAGEGRALRGSPSSRPGGLTPREIDVLRLVAAGRTNAEIATELVVSEHTVHRHVANVLVKLGVPTRTAAAVEASRLGLL